MNNEQLTRAQKAAATNKARKQRREEEWRQELEDRRRAAEILRQIRDDPLSSNSEKIKAIELLQHF